MGKLFGGGGKATKLPEPVRMPSPGDTALREAQRLQIEQMRPRAGRQSTILSENLNRNVNGSAGTLGA